MNLWVLKKLEYLRCIWHPLWLCHMVYKDMHVFPQTWEVSHSSQFENIALDLSKRGGKGNCCLLFHPLNWVLSSTIIFHEIGIFKFKFIEAGHLLVAFHSSVWGIVYILVYYWKKVSIVYMAMVGFLCEFTFVDVVVT